MSTDNQSLHRMINKFNHRRNVTAQTLDNPLSDYNAMMDEIRARDISRRAWESEGKKSNSKQRLLAVLTEEQDIEFTERFGPNYFRNKRFFTEMFPQTLAVRKKDL